MIASKEKFIDLYLATRERLGYVTFTQKYPDDFLPWLKNKKYDDLFSFFHTQSDFDFRDCFLKYYDSGMGSIEVIHRDTSQDTITIRPDFAYHIVPQILEHVEDREYNQMQELINDMEKTRLLNTQLQSLGASGTYQKANPNGFYHLENNQLMVTDGVITDIGDGQFLLEDALFLILERFNDGKLKNVEISSSHDRNFDYVTFALRNLLTMNRENYDNDNFFQEVQKGKVYFYKGRY